MIPISLMFKLVGNQIRCRRFLWRLYARYSLEKFMIWATNAGVPLKYDDRFQVLELALDYVIDDRVARHIRNGTITQLSGAEIYSKVITLGKLPWYKRLFATTEEPA